MSPLYDDICNCVVDAEPGKYPSDNDFKQFVEEALCKLVAASGGGGTSNVIVEKQEPVPLTGLFEAATVSTGNQTIVHNGGPTIRLRILIISSTLDEDVEVFLDGFTGSVRVRAGSSLTIDYGAGDMEKATHIYLRGFAGSLPTTGNISVTAIGPLV